MDKDKGATKDGAQIVTGTLVRLQRLTNSRNGNPRYRFHFDTGQVVDLAADMGDGYSVTESWEGRQVTLTLDGRGKARRASVAK